MVTAIGGMHLVIPPFVGSASKLDNARSRRSPGPSNALFTAAKRHRVKAQFSMLKEIEYNG